jgi:hypothetical protein
LIAGEKLARTRPPVPISCRWLAQSMSQTNFNVLIKKLCFGHGPGTDVMILKIYLQKYLEKKLAFLTKNKS